MFEFAGCASKHVGFVLTYRVGKPNLPFTCLLLVIAIRLPRPHLVGTCNLLSHKSPDMTMSAWRATGTPTAWRHWSNSRPASKCRIDRYIKEHMLLVFMLLGQKQHSMMHMAAFEPSSGCGCAGVAVGERTQFPGLHGQQQDDLPIDLLGGLIQFDQPLLLGTVF